MPKCKYCNLSTPNENGICDDCRRLFDFIKRDQLEEERNHGFYPEISDGWHLPAVLCYLPFCFLLCRKWFPKSTYVGFHVNQGFWFTVLSGVCTVLWLIVRYLLNNGIWTNFGYVASVGLAVIWGFYFVWGILSALTGSGNVLPLIGRRRVIS